MQSEQAMGQGNQIGTVNAGQIANPNAVAQPAAAESNDVQQMEARLAALR